MWPYIALTLSITVIPFFFAVKTDKGISRAKQVTCICSFVLLLLIMGFRNETMGMYDTQYVYHPYFNRLLSFGIKDIPNVINSQQGVLMY